jgi:Cdc25 family phosphatase
MSANTIPNLARISRERLAELVRAKQPGLAIIDVRDSDFIGGHIVGCQNVPTNTHDHAMPELVRNLRDQDTVVFHCALSQQRGPSSALRYLRERERFASSKNQESTSEYKTEGSSEDKAADKKAQTVYVLEGGFTKWQEVFVKYHVGNHTVIKLTPIYLGTEMTKS